MVFVRYSASRDTRVATTKLGLVRCDDYSSGSSGPASAFSATC